MNNLHRELAPVSDKAWAQIEEEASRTLKRHLAARRVVDVVGPKGVDLSAVGTGHLRQIQSPGDGIRAAQREVKALVELRVPFELTRQAIDDVERGANDSDWSPLKDAARKIAFAEDRCGVRRVPIGRHPRRSSRYQQPGVDAPFQRECLSGCGRTGCESIASRRCQWSLRSPVGCGTLRRRQWRQPRWLPGPSSTSGSLSTARSFGPPPSRAAWWSPLVAAILSWTSAKTSPSATSTIPEPTVQLYLQESFTFLLLTTEAAVVLAPPGK